jgi:hypothetical protein
MEYDQGVIIKFLWNDGTDADGIADRLRAQFDEHAYQLQTIRFWIIEARFGRQDLHDEIRTRRPPLDDLDMKILAILNKSPFESAHSISIAERLFVAHPKVLPHLHDSIGFKLFHLHWIPYLLTDNLREKRKGHTRVMFHSCMLPNVMSGIIL